MTTLNPKFHAAYSFISRTVGLQPRLDLLSLCNKIHRTWYRINKKAKTEQNLRQQLNKTASYNKITTLFLTIFSFWWCRVSISSFLSIILFIFSIRTSLQTYLKGVLNHRKTIAMKLMRRRKLDVNLKENGLKLNPRQIMWNIKTTVKLCIKI